MGFIAGLLSGAAGAMGLGGGTILLIYLTLLANVSQLEAQGINLVFFLPCAATALIVHMKNKLLKLKLLPAVGTGLLGAALGLFLSEIIPEGILQKVFAVLLLILGIRELFAKEEKPEEKLEEDKA